MYRDEYRAFRQASELGTSSIRLEVFDYEEHDCRNGSIHVLSQLDLDPSTEDIIEIRFADRDYAQRLIYREQAGFLRLDKWKVPHGFRPEDVQVHRTIINPNGIIIEEGFESSRA